MALLVNRKASFDYEIREKIVAGVVLTGAEVKSLRSGAGSLVGSFVQIVGGAPVLLGAQISPYPYADNRNYDPKATRKLLLRKKEIARLAQKVMADGYTLVPLAFFLHHNKIKLEIGVGRGRKQYEKRQKIKERDLKRELARQEYD